MNLDQAWRDFSTQLDLLETRAGVPGRHATEIPDAKAPLIAANVRVTLAHIAEVSRVDRLHHGR